MRTVNSIADLRTQTSIPANELAYVLGYVTPGDGGGGEFYWDENSTEIDDRGTVIWLGPVNQNPPPAKGRWKRVFSGYINVRWFGAKGDWTGTAGTDDTTAIRNAIAYMKNKTKGPHPATGGPSTVGQGAPENFTLWFSPVPDKVGYLVSGDLDFGTTGVDYGTSYSIIMDAPIIRGGADASMVNGGAALTIGAAEAQCLLQKHKLWVKRAGNIVWGETGYCGIRIINFVRSEFEIVESMGFDIGLQTLGNTKAFSYNKFNVGNFRNNRIGAHITSIGTTISAYNTDCEWRIGRIACDRTYPGSTIFKPTESRYGMVLDGQVYRAEAQIILKAVFELAKNVLTEGEAIPVVINNGSLNVFHNCRHENNNSTFMRVFQGQGNANNWANLVYRFNTDERIEKCLDDRSAAGRNKVTSVLGKLQQSEIGEGRTVYSSGDLQLRAANFDDTRLSVQGFHCRALNTGTISRYLTNDTVRDVEPRIDEDGYLVIPNNQGICFYVDTTVCKRFLINFNYLKADPLVDNKWRPVIYIKAYSYDLCKHEYTLLTDATATTNVRAALTSFTASQFGGSYRETSTTSFNDFCLTAADHVARVEVIISTPPVGQRPTGGEAKLRSFDILSVDGGEPPVITSEFPGPVAASIAPTKGPYEQGRVILNTGSVETDPDLYGWICTTPSVPAVYGENGDDCVVVTPFVPAKWMPLYAGQKAPNDGYFSHTTDGSVIAGTGHLGSIRTSLVTSTIPNTNYPVLSGQAWFLNGTEPGGTDKSRMFAFFYPVQTAASDLYFQRYNAAGAGQGWRKVLDSVNALQTDIQQFSASALEMIAGLQLKQFKQRGDDGNAPVNPATAGNSDALLMHNGKALNIGDTLRVILKGLQELNDKVDQALRK